MEKDSERRRRKERRRTEITAIMSVQFEERKGSCTGKDCHTKSYRGQDETYERIVQVPNFQ